MRTIRLANLNACKLTPATRGTSSWNARTTAIQEIAPDILALQEVVVEENTTSRVSRICPLPTARSRVSRRTGARTS